MRFIVMHKVDAQMESGAPPSGEIVQNMGALVGAGLKSGVFLDGAGLHRSALRVRLRFAAGKTTVTKGPLTGENELVGGFAMISATSMDEAVEHARAYSTDGEIDIGPVVEAWDIGAMPKPATIEKSRFLLVVKGEATPAIDTLAQELHKRGVLLKSEKIGPSSAASRLASGPKGQRAWTDGPFAESKEMIAGFSILSVPSKADALAWADKYAAILDGNEVDVRPMVD